MQSQPKRFQTANPGTQTPKHLMRSRSSSRLPYTISVDTRRAAPANMVALGVQAHILLAIKRLPAAGTKELDLDRTGVRLVLVGVALPRDRPLRHAHVEGLKGVAPCRARRRVTVAPTAVRGEDGARFEVCGRSPCQSGLSWSSCRRQGACLRFSCCRMYPQYVYPTPHVGADALEA